MRLLRRLYPRSFIKVEFSRDRPSECAARVDFTREFLWHVNLRANWNNSLD